MNVFDTFRDRLGDLQAESDSPVVRWSIFFIVLLSIWFWVLEPIGLWVDSVYSQIDRKAQRAARLLVLEQNESLWIQARENADVALALVEGGLFRAQSDTQAQAELQALMSSFADDQNLTVESLKLSPVEVRHFGAVLQLEVSLRGELIDVLHFLDQVSRAEKLFIVNQWVVQMDRSNQAFARFSIAGIRALPLGVQPDV